ncbi:MAG TPA: hypothetical protein VI072_30000 [Polyangiaceae bacterium]
MTIAEGSLKRVAVACGSLVLLSSCWSDEPFVKELPAEGDVCADPDGNIYVSSFGYPLAAPGYTTKYDAEGDSLHTIPRGGDVACDSEGNVIVAQRDNTDNADSARPISKFNGNGQLLWERTYAGRLHLDGSNNVVLIGPRAIRLSPSGALLNDLALSFPAPLNVTQSTVKSAGNLVFAGNFTGTLTMNGRTLTTPGYRTVVFETSWNGQPIWHYAPATSGYVGSTAVTEDTEPTAITTDETGNVIFMAQILGQVEFPDGRIAQWPGTESAPVRLDIIYKLSPSGQPVWGRDYSPFLNPRLELDTDDSGNIVVAGSYHQNYFPFMEPALLKFSPTGELVWEDGATLPGYEHRGGSHYAVDVDAHGNVVSLFKDVVRDPVEEHRTVHALAKRAP